MATPPASARTATHSSGFRRSSTQRAVAARYDGTHALLVRLVHPLCFAAFSLVIAAIAAGVGYLALKIFGDAGALFVIGAVACSALAAGFKFVATPLSATIGIVSLAGSAVVLLVRDDLPTWPLWVLVGVAALSIVIQVVLLVRVVPDRWRNGLMHLLWPAFFGTVLGAVPVVALVSAMLAERESEVRALAAYSFVAGCAVLVVLLGMHWYGARGDKRVLAEFALRHGLRSTGGDLMSSALLAPLTPRYGTRTPWYSGDVRERAVAAVTGYTASWEPDLPSLHITVLGIRLKSSGRDFWVRRNSWTHDNVLASLGRSEVMRFESIRLSNEYTVRFGAGTSQLDAFLTFGPQLVVVLDSELAQAQTCRIGSTLALFVVGGALSADELDGMLAAGLRIADLLERADATAARS